MEELSVRHRKEQRDLQSQVTQRKKQASKKTRKAVNDECERLESELKDRHTREIAALKGDSNRVNGNGEGELPVDELDELALTVHIGEGLHSSKVSGPPMGAEEAESHGQQPGKRRNRQKDRLARRAAEQVELARQADEEAQNLPNLKDEERQRMLASMTQHRLTEKEIRADGHCLYSAVADQLEQHGIPIGDAPSEKPTLAHKVVRARAADYISSHQNDFVPFLEEPLPEYLHKIRDTGEWGGQLELMALAKTYEVNINVLQDFGRVEKIESGSGGDKTIWLGYYKHGFGLGEHYNSLRKAP